LSRLVNQMPIPLTITFEMDGDLLAKTQIRMILLSR
jgi:hypothetical protein